MFRLGLIKISLQSQREELIELINEKAGALSLPCTLVFDATMNPGESTRSHVHHLEIVFTSHGETADEWIIHELEQKRTPKQFTVVTCDKQLAWYARQMHVSTLPIDEFMGMLHRRYANLQKPKKKKKQLADDAGLASKKTLHEKPLCLTPEVEKFPEGSADYYLQVFEKRLKESAEPEKTPVKRQKKGKRKQKMPQEDSYQDDVSEMTRWQRIFEELSKRKQDI
jgi:uncharacterized protein